MTAAKILGGLREAVAVAAGDAAPARSTTYFIRSTRHTSGNVTNLLPSRHIVAALPAKVGGFGVLGPDRLFRTVPEASKSGRAA